MIKALDPAALATSAFEASPSMRRGSWVRIRLRFIDAHQQAAMAATSTADTDAVEVQYSHAGPIGRPQAAEGLPRCSAMAMTPAPRLTLGTG